MLVFTNFIQIRILLYRNKLSTKCGQCLRHGLINRHRPMRHIHAKYQQVSISPIYRFAR